MAVIEYDSYKQKLLALKEEFENLEKALDIESATRQIRQLEAEAEEEGFWNDLKRSQANQMKLKQLQNKVGHYNKLFATRDDLLALVEMGTEMDDDSLLPELEEGYASLEKEIYRTWAPSYLPPAWHTIWAIRPLVIAASVPFALFSRRAKVKCWQTTQARTATS